MTESTQDTHAMASFGLGEPLAAALGMTREQVLIHLRERIVGFAASRYTREAAEDLAQEVLVVIHEKYGHIDRMEDLMPLAFQILRFKAFALRRKTVRHGEHIQVSVEDFPLAGDAPDAEAMLARKELLTRLSAGIAQMGERCQELFRFKLQGKSFPEIRHLMGAEALNTVYTWDHRCRKQLLEKMGGRWER
ncbi:MAG: sigma-70 family RNA polymerase sigma factor [Holophaga sp.]|nr:sigma-70 family RNA polymerase sigma factor [Holophaga sp.]